MPISSYKMSVLRLGSGSRASSGQHGESSAGLRSDWRGLPIICRSCAQTRSRPAPSQVNFRCTPYPPRYTPDIAPSLALLFVIPQRSGGICFFSCPCLFSPLPVFSVVCSCCHPERSRSQSHRERLSRRTCGCLFLPLSVLAVILSEAKDPDALHPAATAHPFLPQSSSPRVSPIGFSLRRNFPHHENAYPAPTSLPPLQLHPRPRTRRAPHSGLRRSPRSLPIHAAAARSRATSGNHVNAAAVLRGRINPPQPLHRMLYDVDHHLSSQPIHSKQNISGSSDLHCIPRDQQQEHLRRTELVRLAALRHLRQG